MFMELRSIMFFRRKCCFQLLLCKDMSVHIIAWCLPFLFNVTWTVQPFLKTSKRFLFLLVTDRPVVQLWFVWLWLWLCLCCKSFHAGKMILEPYLGFVHVFKLMQSFIYFLIIWIISCWPVLTLEWFTYSIYLTLFSEPECALADAAFHCCLNWGKKRKKNTQTFHAHACMLFFFFFFVNSSKFVFSFELLPSALSKLH